MSIYAIGMGDMSIIPSEVKKYASLRTKSIQIRELQSVAQAKSITDKPKPLVPVA